MQGYLRDGSCGCRAGATFHFGHAVIDRAHPVHCDYPRRDRQEQEGYVTRSILVGSGTGAILRRFRLAVAPRFLWECLSSRTVSWFPAPATSNPSCRFPAIGLPVAFLSRVNCWRPTNRESRRRSAPIEAGTRTSCRLSEEVNVASVPRVRVGSPVNGGSPDATAQM